MFVIRCPVSFFISFLNEKNLKKKKRSNNYGLLLYVRVRPSYEFQLAYYLCTLDIERFGCSSLFTIYITGQGLKLLAVCRNFLRPEMCLVPLKQIQITNR